MGRQPRKSAQMRNTSASSERKPNSGSHGVTLPISFGMRWRPADGTFQCKKKAHGHMRLLSFILLIPGADHRSLVTPSKRESQGLTIIPFTSLRYAAVSTTSEKGWIDMTTSSMYCCTPS